NYNWNITSTSQASKSFELIHLDLKEFPMKLYHKYKYYMSFVDNYSSYAWVTALKKKSDAIDALKNFLAAAKNQNDAKVK
ncbi:hypothetical protein AX16_000814, partial [Volvariella volvacea WC 439]